MKAYLEDTLRQLRKYKGLAEAAIAQVAPDDLFRTIDPESNSIAIVMKHVSGNMRSRWRDFLTTDGEKPDRRRDREFEREPGDDPGTIRARWEEGWRLAFAAIEPLRDADLERIVTVRGEPHTVFEAIARQLTHYAYHVGQIVTLARHFAGPRWRSLSIPKGESARFDVSKEGRPYEISPRPGSGRGESCG